MTNKEKYQEFCKKEKNIPVFLRDWWLDNVCRDGQVWDVALVEKGGSIFAAMPYVQMKKLNMISICHPMLTQTMGIYFNYPKKQKYYKKLSFEKEMINKILKQLPDFAKFSQSFNYEMTNLLPFYWSGFDIKVNYTYVIENITIENIEEKFETDIRRRRKKANKYGVRVVEGNDIKKFYELNNKTFIRQNINIPYEFSFIENLYNVCKVNNACKMFFAEDSNGNLIAANFLIFDENTVYYLMGGIDPENKDLGGMDVVQYESIKFALESGRKFDFEGSMIESIEKYFRSFGAIQKPYFNVSIEKSKILKFKRLIRELIK